MAYDPQGRDRRVDDPTGGAGLTRRLVRWLPVAAVAGALVGAVAVVLGADWRTIPAAAALAVAVAGTVLAAVEDGRVQRRIDRMPPPRRDGRPPGAADDPGRHPL